VKRISENGTQVAVAFGENVTVKGRPRLALRDGGFADYVNGSGTDTLVFTTSAGANAAATRLDFNGGTIVACEASAVLRVADTALQ